VVERIDVIKFMHSKASLEKPRQMSLDIPETMKAWLAGFVDGEGCFMINKRSRKLSKKRPESVTSIQFSLHLTVVNTNKESLELCRDIYGGHLWVRTPPKDKPHWKIGYVWHVTKLEVLRRVLRDIEPYSVIKSSQVKIALMFLETFKGSKNERTERVPRQHGRKLSGKVIDMRQNCKNLLMGANNSGRRRAS
jgi:hypothetical protein